LQFREEDAKTLQRQKDYEKYMNGGVLGVLLHLLDFISCGIVGTDS